MFEAKPKLSARNFRKYVCTGRYIADEKAVAETEKDGVERKEHVGASSGTKQTAEEKVWTNEKAVAEATVHVE